MDARPIGCFLEPDPRYQVGRDRWSLGAPDITRLARMDSPHRMLLQTGRYQEPDVTGLAALAARPIGFMLAPSEASRNRT